MAAARFKWIVMLLMAAPFAVYASRVRPLRVETSSILIPTPAPTAAIQPGQHPTLDDFWDGRAEWVLDVPDTGLPLGESDTIVRPDGEWWSYLHASDESAGIRDSCGDPVAFPGCVTRWVSSDGGRHFELAAPTCVFECRICPCDEADQIAQQQYPRVTRSPGGGFYMAYEHGGSAWVSFSPDGVTWYPPDYIQGTGLWVSEMAACEGAMRIGPHPAFIHEAECMAGGPPGIFIDEWTITVFVGLGQNPGHMGCFAAPVGKPDAFAPCQRNPLFGGAQEYGPLDLLGAAANAYFDFRFTTSADVVKVGDTFYMTYEGIRGPSTNTLGRDDQFGLGFARAQALDGAWEKYPGNPILGGMADNWGIGHADIVIADGITYLYTATPDYVRGRYRLVFR